MKILTLVWSIGIGGTERAAVNYAIGYKLFGNDSRVLVLGEGHERYQDLKEAGVETTLITKSTSSANEIFNEYKQWNPDIIHIHNYNDSLFSYISLLKGTHTKIVETNVFSRPNFNAGYQIIDLSMQLSAWGYWKYSRCMKRATYSPKAVIVPYIVDGLKFEAPADLEKKSFLNLHGIPANTYVIGRIGQAHPSKWDIRLINVIKQTIHPENNIYYLLVGTPDILTDLFNRQTTFFKSRVKLINKIEGDRNLSLYYHSLNCFAHISKIGESFGYVLAEALVCKIPVITMLTPLKDNAQFEVVGHEYGGFCVSNTSEFVQAVHKLHNNRKLELSIKENLGDWIEKRFSYKAVVPPQIELYKALLAGKQLPSADARSTVMAIMKHYNNRRWLTFFLARCVNNPVFFKLINVLKKRTKPA